MSATNREPSIAKPANNDASAQAPNRPDSNPKNVVNSVAKAFSVLHAFSSGQVSLSVSEIAIISKMDRGTTFRLVHTLVGLGYLRAAPERKFRLTLKCLDLGYLALSSQDLWWHAQPLLEECVPEFCDAASLGTLEGPDVIYLARADKNLERHNLDRRPGRRIRAYGAALGHAILAFLPLTKQVEVLASAERVKLSERTLTGLDELLERFRQVREQGYAISDGENAYGLRTVAVPVLDAANCPVAGISMTIDALRMPIDEFVTLVKPRALTMAEELSRALRASSGAIHVSSTR